MKIKLGLTNNGPLAPQESPVNSALSVHPSAVVSNVFFSELARYLIFHEVSIQ